MAQKKEAFSSKDFKVGIKAEATIGDGGAAGTFTLLNVDSVEFPSFNPIQVFEPRNGSRVAEDNQAFQTNKGVDTEISFSGILDANSLANLVQNVTGVAHATNLVSVTASTTPPSAMGNGDTSAVNKTLEIAVFQPTTSDEAETPTTTTRAILMKGATITSFAISGDYSDGGRLKFSATAKSGFVPSFNGSASFGSLATAFYNISDYSERTVMASSNDVTLQAFSLNVENPAEYRGFNDSGEPQSIVRAVPEGPNVTMSATVKYDDDTAGLVSSKFFSASKQSAQNLLSDNSTIASASASGFELSKAVITGMSLNDNAAMFYDIDFKGLFGTFKIMVG